MGDNNGKIEPVDMAAMATEVVDSMKNASETVRKAMADTIPIANNQVLTISLPGTIIDWKEYYYNVSKHIKPPLDIQVKEARLVDGMIPLSKFTAGKTGKSVARSYLSALDLLIPVEASVSGAISSDNATITDERLKTIRDRYNYSMTYLTSADEIATSTGARRTKVETYVQKQSAWAREVAAYTQAQGQALERFQPPLGATTAQIKEGQEKYMQWLQEHAREFKNNIQTKYMDWVVHGYKFMVDFHFGVVDISSGMKRIENSKEAYRNLTIIASDGSSEYNGVVLSPGSWATIVAKKVLNWKKNNSNPSPTELRSEIRRLQNLVDSHTVLRDAIEGDAFFPVLENGNQETDKAGVKKAYAEVYTDMDRNNQTTLEKSSSGDADKLKLDKFFSDMGLDKVNPAKSPYEDLQTAQNTYNLQSLAKNNNTVRNNKEATKKMANGWLEKRIEQLNREIEELKTQLDAAKKEGDTKVALLPVVNPDGSQITEDQLVANAGVKSPVVAEIIDLDSEETWRNKVDDGPDPWTKIHCSCKKKKDESSKTTSQSASSVAAKVGWGLFRAEGGVSHTSSSAQAMSAMSNLDVEISMSCMVVEIERPWLHAELFVDAELDSGKFEISPGEEELKKAFTEERSLEGKYQQFSSYPTAFVVAADVELTFSGDTSKLESAMSASSTQANLSVGYGPFAISGSHSNSKSSNKTKMESTATGCRISVEAPQIVGWVQTLLPQLPKPKNGTSTMVGPFGK